MPGMCSFSRRSLVLFVCLLCIVVTAANVRLGATVIVPADLGELTRDAYVVAIGRVVATDAQWTPGRRSIETMVTLETDSYLKGDMGATVEFRVPGGVMGRYRNIVMGAPTFAVGQRVVVFLGVKGPSIPFVLGASQGVFRVVEQAGSAAMVMPLPVEPGATGPLTRGAPSRAPTTLSAFSASVRALVGGER